MKLKQKLDRVLAENDLSFDGTEELWTETPSASPSGICGEAAEVTSTAPVMSIPKQKSSWGDSICEESSEEFFTPPLPPGNCRAPISKTPLIAAGSFEEDFRVEETDLAENDENLPNDGNSASKNSFPSTDNVPPKKRKFNFTKALLEGKGSAKVDESETADSLNAERVTTSMGSQCSIESSHDFVSNRCMLTTATGKCFIIIALYILKYSC